MGCWKVIVTVVKTVCKQRNEKEILLEIMGIERDVEVGKAAYKL